MVSVVAFGVLMWLHVVVDLEAMRILAIDGGRMVAGGWFIGLCMYILTPRIEMAVRKVPKRTR